MRILLVDDSRAVRSLLRRIVQAHGFDEVFEAGDGKAALERLEQSGAPDVMLVDWNMPRMNGLELVRAVRGNAEWRDVPIVMVTTETEYDQIVRAFAAGASEYVMKPFTEESIIDKFDLIGVTTTPTGSESEAA
jgi:two-component system chemotaxis response regulator CheY